MFWLGGLPALLAFYISARVPESEAWKQHRAPSTGAVLRIVATQWKSFLYLVLLMTFMMFLSHGTQDLYPDFLGTVHKLGAGDAVLHGDPLQHRRHRRRDHLRAALGKAGPQTHHDLRRCRWRCW